MCFNMPRVYLLISRSEQIQLMNVQLEEEFRPGAGDRLMFRLFGEEKVKEWGKRYGNLEIKVQDGAEKLDADERIQVLND